MKELGAKVNLVICQKSKIQDWFNHFANNYRVIVNDLTNKKEFDYFIGLTNRFDLSETIIGIINYDLIFRRSDLLQLKNFTLMLDESSLIQNEGTQRTKFIMSLTPKNVILLSGTPTGGKYERLISQMHLLGWKISENTFWNQYVDWEWNETHDGFWQKKILGYKNEERLKRKMRQHGCQFLKTEEVFDLPEQIQQTIRIDSTKEYKLFKKNDYLEAFDQEFIGDTTLTKMLYERQLCGQYNDDKLSAFQDLLRETEDRIIVFYNFTDELNNLMDLADGVDRPISIVNGQEKSLECYEQYSNSITFIQYQAGAKGLNLQKANKMIFFTPTLSTEDYMQAKKRIHRIGQSKPCFYYHLVCKNTIEEKIYHNISRGIDYTERLFLKDVHGI